LPRRGQCQKEEGIMKHPMRIGVALGGIVAGAFWACEMSTNIPGVAGPPNDHGKGTAENVTNGRSEKPSRLRRPAVGGGPLIEVRQISGAEAMWSIAGARCDREAVCNRIGPSGKYANRDECMASLQKDEGSDFTERSCPDGVSESGLAGCLRAIGEGDGKGRRLTRQNACLAAKFSHPPPA